MAKRPPPKRRRVPARQREVPAAPDRDRPAPTPGPADITIVGVGASAGGLEAFTQLLEAVDADAGLTLVLVQHLSPHHESALPALLSAHTAMPVVQVTDGVRIEPNHVYVIPPNVQMAVSGDLLQLSPRPDDRTAHTPVDSFFASLAASARERAVAVVLSGTASDGAIGVREIKAAGGITFAQTPASAKFDGMPRAAIATGMVDLVMEPDEIGRELAAIVRHPYSHAPDSRGVHAIGDDPLRRIFDLLRPVSGVDFRHYKQPTVRRRLLRRMALHRIPDVERYISLLEDNPVELRGLFSDLLIHVTRFFREPESFEALAAEVFPRLVNGRDPDRPIRVWVCGCATGEEAYSLAIALQEFIQERRSNARVQIFATDVSDVAVEHARAGTYPSTIGADVGADRLRRFFTRNDGKYRVSKQVRDMCVFARQDLTKDPPFSRLDLVMCRNVLIYMDTVLQRKLISLFHYALNPDGYLVLGQAESVAGQAGLFALIDKRFRIHKKKSAVAHAGAPSRPAEHVINTALRTQAASAADPDKGLQGEVSRLILDRYSPAGVVVDADLQIVQVRGQTGPFLEPAPGEASLSLLKMVREGLLYGVRGAIDAAKKSKAPVRRTDLRLRVGQSWRRVAVEVVPLTVGGRQHYLVLFDDAPRAPAGWDAAPHAVTVQGRRAARATGRKPSSLSVLRRELEANREYMQSIIQELEAANEELQSANEEILSSNEELQSTNEELDTAKEELQSTNEELNTVNEELQSRNEEMSRVNSDLINLVGSVQIAIVIVGSDLRIRRFTPMAEQLLNLIPADLDRSIAHINPNIDCPNLPALIIECMDAVAPIERDVRDRQGRWHALRIRPYRSLDNKIEGAVLALFDIDILKRSEQSTQRAQAFADGLLDGTDQPIAILEHDLRLHKANAAFADLFNRKAAEMAGKPIAEVGGPAWALPEWRAYAAGSSGKLPAATVKMSASRSLVLDARTVPSPDAPEKHLLMVTVRDDAR